MVLTISGDVDKVRHKRALATRTATCRTATGTTASSTSTGRTSTIAIQTCVPVWKYQRLELLSRGSFLCRYTSQPCAIFEASTSFSCKEKYLFSSITSSSWHNRTRRFVMSIRMRKCFTIVIFSDGSVSAASMESVMQSSAALSARAYTPNRSRFGTFLPV